MSEDPVADLVELRRQLGRRVAERRAELGLTQAELAALLDRSESWVSQVERGVRAVDRVSIRERLAATLDLSVRELFPLPKARFTRRELVTEVRNAPPTRVRGVVSAAFGDILMVRLDFPLDHPLPKRMIAVVTLLEEKPDGTDRH